MSDSLFCEMYPLISSFTSSMHVEIVWKHSSDRPSLITVLMYACASKCVDKNGRIFASSVTLRIDDMVGQSVASTLSRGRRLVTRQPNDHRRRAEGCGERGAGRAFWASSEKCLTMVLRELVK